jgi:hypothetical protein
MNGTPIDKLRYMQQMPSQQFTGDMQTGDGFGEEMGRQGGNMDRLAQEVNDSLDDLNNPPEVIQQRNIRMSPQHKYKETDKETSKGKMGNVPIFLREPLIIMVIYVILSLDIVKKTLASYIPQIKPSSDGSILFVGIVIYAMILAISYAVAKKLLL